MSDIPIGFIGLGVMGEPMCRNLRERSGHRVIAFDLNPEPLQRLAEYKVESAKNAADIMQQCDVVFVSLPSGKQLEILANGKNGLLENARAGQTLVDLGTSPVALTRKLAAAFAKRKVDYLDAPVARTRKAAESGTLAVMVGGDDAVLKKVLPLMECFATEITHCGGVGSGQVTKILNNMVLFQTVVALSEAYSIAQGAGCNAEVLFEALSKGSADSFALRNHGMKAILPREFPERAFSVEYALKDLGYALELAGDAKVDAAGARNVRTVFKRAIKAGAGDQYFPVVSRVLNREI